MVYQVDNKTTEIIDKIGWQNPDRDSGDIYSLVDKRLNLINEYVTLENTIKTLDNIVNFISQN